MSIEDNIKTWVALDNKHKKLNQEVKDLRDKKNLLSDKIINNFSQYNNSPTIRISDGKLNISSLQQANVISYKFLYECFNIYFQNHDKANDLLNLIKSKRNYTNTPYIKRIYNKE